MSGSWAPLMELRIRSWWVLSGKEEGVDFTGVLGHLDLYIIP